MVKKWVCLQVYVLILVMVGGASDQLQPQHDKQQKINQKEEQHIPVEKNVHANI